MLKGSQNYTPSLLGIQKEVHGIKRKGERRGEEEGARGKEEALGGTPAFPVLVKKADSTAAGTGQGREGLTD